jgi:dipeptidyl aminopeptidase/acylaminoacyl peptidase
MRLLVYASVGAGALVALSLLAFWVTVRPPRIVIPLRPEEVGLRPEEVSIRTDDGLRLAAWLVARPGPAAVVLLHGYPAEKNDMLPLASALGARVTTLLVDQRYFGKSEGRATTLGARERRDLVRAVDFLAGRGFTRVGVFGFSLGGAVGLLAAAEDPRIRAVVAYGAFADLRALGREAYGHLWLLKYPLVELMTLWGRLFLGLDLTRPSPVEAAARLTIPVLLIHSREDEQIGFHHALRLKEALAANPRADLLVLERGRHGETGADVQARLIRFFTEHLEHPAAREGPSGTALGGARGAGRSTS